MLRWMTPFSRSSPGTAEPMHPHLVNVSSKLSTSTWRNSFSGSSISTDKGTIPLQPDGGRPEKQPHYSPLYIAIESPPLFFYGKPAVSTGALLTGQLMLFASDEQITLTNMSMVLMVTVVVTQPVDSRCSDCTGLATKKSEIHRWEFLEGQQLTLCKGEHAFPFTYLIPGHLPITTHGPSGSIEYSLHAEAMTSSNGRLDFTTLLNIGRAIDAGQDRVALRLVPETDITIKWTMPVIVHPMGDFSINLRLDKLVRYTDGVMYQWNLTWLTWRLEELQRVVARACTKHLAKSEGRERSRLNEQTRIIGEKELKAGWKTDMTVPGGQIDMDFSVSFDSDSQPLCDVLVESEPHKSAYKISHSLVVEFVVVEQSCPVETSAKPKCTGKSHHLRTRVHLVMAEDCGMGISWEQEQPPIYWDVPPNPPAYAF